MTDFKKFENYENFERPEFVAMLMDERRDILNELGRVDSFNDIVKLQDDLAFVENILGEQKEMVR